MKILGILRGQEFSPNHIGNDAAILKAVAANLTDAGLEVSIVDEVAFMALSDDELPPLIFQMARHHDTIQRLCRLEENGTIVLNAAHGVVRCGRETMTRTLAEHDIPQPAFAFADTDRPVFATSAPLRQLMPGWLKRGDLHAMHREDVSYVRTAQEADELLQEYHLRGIGRVVVNEHLHGDLVKFYGVRGTPFFYWFYPTASEHSKFGLEAHNDCIRQIQFDTQKLHEICTRAAHALDVAFYGGDCIIAADGSFRIIDFNDWPSFAPCRQTAALYISNVIEQAAAQKK